MKKPLFSKQLFIFGLIAGVTVNANSQEKPKELSSPKKAIEKPIELDKSDILAFPIKSTKTTDANYEQNVQKSKETQANYDRKPLEVVKNDQYYTDKIVELKRRIQEILDNSDSPSSNPDKLEGLRAKLVSTEQEYTEF
jgi:hypothetical protein